MLKKLSEPLSEIRYYLVRDIREAMRNKKQILKKISKSVSKYYGHFTDFQLVWAHHKSNDNGAEIIEITIVPGDVFRNIMRMEKIEILAGKTDGVTEKRLYDAIKKYNEDSIPSMEEFIPFW